MSGVRKNLQARTKGMTPITNEAIKDLRMKDLSK